MKLGDLVMDKVTGKPVIILATDVSGNRTDIGTWDFEVLTDNGEFCYVDQDEVEKINYENFMELEYER